MKSQGVKTECAQCKSVLFRFPSKLKSKYGSFCDRHCLGKFRTAVLTGKFAANYKTGSRKSRSYIEVEAHWNPGSNKRGYISLHRLIAEARLGRHLLDTEIVHHKDHNPRNNHWDNLEVITQAQHAKEHYASRKKNKHGQFCNN